MGWQGHKLSYTPHVEVKGMKKFFGILALFCALTMAGAAMAATPQAGKPVQDKPEKGADRVTVVSVTLDGTDSIGARLGTNLKERFNKSSLFTLNDDEEKDVPKLYVMVESKPEFSSRPGVGSVYSVCCVFKQCKGYLGYLLARDLGTINYEDLDGLVDRLVDLTFCIAAKYSRLWK